MPDITASALWWQRCEPSKLQFLVKNRLFRKIYFQTIRVIKMIIGIINIHIKANKYEKLYQDLKM